MGKRSPVAFLAPLHGTWLGGLLGHFILIPLWTLSPFPLLAAIVMIFCGSTWSMAGLLILALFLIISAMIIPYQPWVVKMFYDLDLPRYYAKCELRGPNLGSMGHEKTLFMFHPHGILAAGFVVNGVWGRHFNALTSKTDLDEPSHTGTVFLIARNLREWAPLFKVLCDLSGRLESATKNQLQSFMRKGRNIAIIPGGFEDATLQEFGKHRTMMRSRKGLVKYALQHGYALTPVYSFGETETYHTFTGLLKQRLALNQYSIPAVLFFGCWAMPLFPRLDSQILTYVGAPLQLPCVPEPSATCVDEWHAKYLDALTQLFETHKVDAGQPDATLEIW